MPLRHAPSRLALLVVLGASVIAAAAMADAPSSPRPTLLLPGDRRVEGRRVRPYTNRWKITYRTPTGAAADGGPGRAGMWYDTLAIVRRDARRELLRRQTLLNPAGEVLEVIDNYVDPVTLAPILSETRSKGGGISRRSFAGARVSGFDLDSATATSRSTIDTTLAEPVFDYFGGLFGILLVGFPLRNGFVAEFPTNFGGASGPDGLTHVTVTALGTERIDAGPLGRVMARHVTSKTPQWTFDYWLSDRPPYIIRLVLTGPRGGKQIYEMV